MKQNSRQAIPITVDEELIVKFKNKNTTKHNDCILWCGATTSNGYGNFSYRGKNYLAHRIAFAIKNGVINSFLQINHSCNNRLCINPDHLVESTARQNSIDATQCGTIGKINHEIAKNIREDFNNNIKIEELVEKYKISRSSIRRVVNNLTWNEKEILPLNIRRVSKTSYEVRLYKNKSYISKRFKSLNEAQEFIKNNG